MCLETVYTPVLSWALKPWSSGSPRNFWEDSMASQIIQGSNRLVKSVEEIPSIVLILPWLHQEHLPSAKEHDCDASLGLLVISRCLFLGADEGYLLTVPLHVWKCGVLHRRNVTPGCLLQSTRQCFDSLLAVSPKMPLGAIWGFTSQRDVIQVFG